MTEDEALATVDSYGQAPAASAGPVHVPGVTEKPKASKAESFAQGLERGGSFGFADEAQAALDTAVSKIPGLRSIAEKSRGAFARVLPGSAHLPVDDPSLSYAQRRDFYRQKADEGDKAHPGYALLGNVAGGIMTAPIGATGAGVGRMAASAATQGAAAGLGNSSSDLMRGDVGGALRDTAEGGAVGGVLGAVAGGANRALEGAGARVLKRIPEDVVAGETKARQPLARGVQAKAGEEGNGMIDMLQRHPDVEKALATTAQSAPKKALKVVDAKSEDLTKELNGIYKRMSEADRAVSPTDIATEFDKMLGSKLANGDLVAVKALRTIRQQFLNEYGNYGKLPAGAMRGLKSTAAKVAGFDQDTPLATKQEVSRDVWKVFANAIERQAKGTPGVDVGRLREINSDLGTLIPVSAALQDRALTAGAHVMSAGSLALHGASAIAGASAGGAGGHSIAGTIAGLAAPQALKLGAAGARQADFALLTAQRGLAKTSGGKAVMDLVQRGMPYGAAVEAAQGAARQIDQENSR